MISEVTQLRLVAQDHKPFALGKAAIRPDTTAPAATAAIYKPRPKHTNSCHWHWAWQGGRRQWQCVQRLGVCHARLKHKWNLALAFGRNPMPNTQERIASPGHGPSAPAPSDLFKPEGSCPTEELFRPLPAISFERGRRPTFQYAIGHPSSHRTLPKRESCLIYHLGMITAASGPSFQRARALLGTAVSIGPPPTQGSQGGRLGLCRRTLQ